MIQNAVIEEIEQQQLNPDIPEFGIGDTLKVQSKIIEGQKERSQIFDGTVIARRGGGLSETFALYRISHGTAVEKVFLLHSPRIMKIEVVRKGKVRQGKLYYLRGKMGKKAKVPEKIMTKKKA